MKNEVNKSAENISFRDPAGRLLNIEGRIIRVVNKSGEQDLKDFLSSAAAEKNTKSGSLVITTILGDESIKELQGINNISHIFNNSSMVVEHERITFQSFPYEWPAEMLYASGRLTLDFAVDLLKEGFGIKDATPYNILFRGCHPVFIDLLSVERRDQGDPIWSPYAQFVRTFLLPLLINKHLGLPLDQIFLTRRDGLEPEEAYRLLSPLKRLKSPFLTLASIPTWLAAGEKKDNPAIYHKKHDDNFEKARYILSSLFAQLRKNLNKSKPVKGKDSAWSDYMCSNNYTTEHIGAKQIFIENLLAECKPKMVLDVGCNTGYFSAIVARSGAAVVAIDYDPVVVGSVWRKASKEGLDILPLVVNITRPSPAAGWRNLECQSFLDRARGGFDAVFMLAVIHHMLVTERIPLDEIVDLAAEITTDILVIEYVSPQDSMFRRLTRGRDNLFEYLSTDVFETSCRRHFEIIRVQHLDNTERWLYLMRKKVSG
ncbi:class I SAM-dependent methyltransferase [Pelotomaculum propionicicum]|uniref:class I SAM-dependent methyltransferase n=1 Tax=Pelotomaculum propionicicum TaxID=258475 RepID=UPI003B765EAD